MRAILLPAWAVVALALGAVLAHAREEESWLSRQGLFRVTYTAALQPITINQIHDWILQLETADGAPVENATIVIDGGMPSHNHGLPTAPNVEAELGGGAYRVTGMRFHMRGDWEIRLTIDDGQQRDLLIIPLRL